VRWLGCGGRGCRGWALCGAVGGWLGWVVRVVGSVVAGRQQWPIRRGSSGGLAGGAWDAWADGLAAGGDQARLVGEDDRLDAVTEGQLGEDARHVGFHRRLGQDKFGGYLGVRQAARDQAEDL
jgi:hypothetical protein